MQIFHMQAVHIVEMPQTHTFTESIAYTYNKLDLFRAYTVHDSFSYTNSTAKQISQASR